MTKEEAIKQLNDLRYDRMAFVTGDDNEHDEIYLADIKAIDFALNVLKSAESQCIEYDDHEVSGLLDD